MNSEDLLMYGFLLGFFVSSLEFLLLGIIKIMEYLTTNTLIFYATITAPAIAIVSLVLLMVKS